MEADRPSATAEGAAIMRALHQSLPAETRVLDDPIASRLVDPAGVAYQARLAFLAGLSAPVRSRLTNFVMRSRYAEDCLADAFQFGIRQYVVLGAGLDTFAYRQPAWAHALRIFEVDHPATQAWKRTRLDEAGVVLPSNLAFAEVDFDRMSLTDGLSSAHFDFAAPTFFSLLGVSQYLNTEGLERTLAFVLGMPKVSEIVLSFVPPEDALPSDDAALAATFAARFAAIGEPWVTRPSPDRLVAMLKAMGFSNIIHLMPSKANARYFRDRRDDLSASLIEQMVRAVV
jgi:methyltransferase (TIGR00027 family)